MKVSIVFACLTRRGSKLIDRITLVFYWDEPSKKNLESTTQCTTNLDLGISNAPVSNESRLN